MPILPVYEWLGLNLDGRQRVLLNATALAVIGFVLVDWAVIHPFIWGNDPSSLYWLAKPLWAGAPMLAVAWWFYVEENGTLGRSLIVAGLAGIVSLQLYYTVIPVPIDGGGAIQIGLVGNLTEGLIVHFGGLAIVLAVVLLLKRRLD